MKRFVLLAFILCCVVQAQSYGKWILIKEGKYIFEKDLKSAKGIESNRADPGEYLGTLFDVTIYPDYIFASCEKIYFKGATETELLLKKRIFRQFVDGKTRKDWYDFISSLTQNKDIGLRLSGYATVCVDSNSGDFIDVDYQVKQDTPIVYSKTLNEIIAFLYDSRFNTLTLNISDAKPTP